MTDPIRNAIIARSGRFNQFDDELVLHEAYDDAGHPGYMISQETTLVPDDNDATPGYFRSPKLFYDLTGLDAAMSDLLDSWTETFEKVDHLGDYPKAWARGIDLDILRLATNDEIRRTLEAAVRDGILVTKAGTLR